MNSTHSAAYDAWINRARGVPIETEINKRGIKLKRAGAERVGACPKCGGVDRFAVNVAKQLFNCRGCNARGDVIDLVMFLDACDFVHAGATLAGEPPHNTGIASITPAKAKPNGKNRRATEGLAGKGLELDGEPKKIVAARFDYTDEAGNLLFQVERVEWQNPDGSFVVTADGKRKKTFRQRRPDPDRLDGWLWNVAGVPAVPYRLPELLEALGNGYLVVIVEGEAKVDLLASWNVPATCCAGGAKKWSKQHAEFLRDADVIILPDNDAPGREHADIVAASLQNIAASIRVLNLPGLPPKGDVIDWAKAGGTVERLIELVEARDNIPPERADERPEVRGEPLVDAPPAMSPDEYGEPAQPAESKNKSSKALVAFPLRAFKNICLDTERRGYLVKGLLAATGLAVIWGPPKCGKSFWALDIALHISLGREYRGRKVQQTSVVYIALEGRHGFPARIEAFKQYHGVDDAPFYLLTTPLDLAKQADALIASIQAQLGTIQPGAIFIDTLNRSLAGSESKDEDMARYLAGAGKLEEKFNCAVIIVHHCGIDGSRPRGHTSLTGTVESQLKVERAATGEVIITVEFAKDFAEGAEVVSRLELVELGTDPDGDPITSFVVQPTEAAVHKAERKGRGPSKGQRAIEAAIDETLDSNGKAITPRVGMPEVRAVKVNDVRPEFERRYVVAETDPAKVAHAKRMAFNRALDKLSPTKFGTGSADGADWVWKI